MTLILERDQENGKLNQRAKISRSQSSHIISFDSYRYLQTHTQSHRLLYTATERGR